MDYALEGIVLGLTLSILLGPIFIALTQTSIERGARAGLTVGLGIWVSDFIIIYACYTFIQRLAYLQTDPSFHFWMGLIGGLVLIVFGISASLAKVQLSDDIPHFGAANAAGYWLKGFLVNTVNPFTFIFWITVISTHVIGRQAHQGEAWLFLGAILVTIIVTDSAKVLAAKLLRTRLTAQHIQLVTRIAGVGLVSFGIYLLIRTGGSPF